jgi:hypothetical protein
MLRIVREEMWAIARIIALVATLSAAGVALVAA